MSEVQKKARWVESRDGTNSLGCLGADALQRVPLASDLFGVGLGHTVRAGGVDAAIMRLVGIPQEMRAFRALQGRTWR